MVVELACLTSVAAVSRAVRALRNVEMRVSELLDPSVLWAMPTACEKSPGGVVRLLGRIAAREDPDMDPLLKHWNFTMCLVKVIWCGDLEVVKWLVEEYLPEGRIRKPVLTAVENNQLEILQWLDANHKDRVVWDISRARMIKPVNLDTLKWAHENIVPVNTNMKKRLMKLGVRCRFVDCVEWLHSLNLPFVQPDLDLAVRTGSIAMVEWIRDHTDARFTKGLLETAVCAERIGMARWLYSNYGFSSVSAGAVVTGIENRAFLAIDGDHHIPKEFITWLLEHLTIFNKEELARAIDVIVDYGDLEVVEKIHEVSGNGLCTTRAMDRTATNGRLDLVKWLHENRSEGCTPAAMDGAAGNGHLKVVKFLHEYRNEGCTSAAMDGAAENGHHTIVKWLHTNRGEGCTPHAMDLAAGNGHLAIVEFLHENRREGCTTNAMDWAAGNGHLEVVKWVHENRSKGCTFEAMNKAAANGHLETVKWLYENRSEGCIDSALHYATKNRQYEVARWLYRRKINDESMLKDSNDGKFKYLIQELKWDAKIATVSGAQSVMCEAITSYTKEEVSWLLQHLPDYQFSSRLMVTAIYTNRLDIAILLEKDGRFPCDFSCVEAACASEYVEIFQLFVRDISDSIAGSREFVVEKASQNQFMQDALIELQYLRKQ